MKLEEIIDEIILENEELFNKEELLMINSNLKVIKKIYLLGLINGKQIYGKKLLWYLSTFYLLSLISNLFY